MSSRPTPIRIVWAGHATARIEMDGVALLIDPLLRRRLGHLHRVAPAPGPVADGPSAGDATVVAPG